MQKSKARPIHEEFDRIEENAPFFMNRTGNSAHDHRTRMKNEIREGLSKKQKTLPCKYFYDDRGSRLFEDICCTPEYYPTQTELSILKRNAHEIMKDFVSTGGDLIELGNGSNRKIRIVLDAVNGSDLKKIRYIPVDISKAAIEQSTENLQKSYPSLQIHGLVADFTKPLSMRVNGTKLILFLGGTLGNFAEEERLSFLRGVRGIMSAEDRFVLGIDMVKPVSIIEAAYNDRQGITAEFNRNLLRHVNYKFNADFKEECFEHVAFFNRKMNRIEMHLRATCDMLVTIRDLSMKVTFKKGETIHTECSHKFERETADRMFQKAGMAPEHWYLDSNEWFSLVSLRTT